MYLQKTLITWCCTIATCKCSKVTSSVASVWVCQSVISQLPKLCVKISILMHRRTWVRSFSTRLTSVTFAEDKVLIFLILRNNAKIVQLSLTLILTLISRADWSDKLEWYSVERYIVFYKSGPINERRHGQRPPCCIHDVIHDDNEMGNRPISYQDVALHEYCNFHA